MKYGSKKGGARPSHKPGVLELVTTLLEDCAGYREGDDLLEQYRLALAAYFMRPRGDEVKGRSRVVSGDISAMTDAVLAQAMAAVTSPNVCEFPGDNADDEEQAALETAAVTSVIFNRPSHGYIGLQSGVKNAVLLANGFAKIWVDDNPRATQRVFRNVTPEAYAELTKSRPGVKLEKINWSEGTLRYSEQRSAVRVRYSDVDPNNFVYTKDWDSFDLEDIPCCGERFVTLRGKMISEHGFSRELTDQCSVHADSGGARSARNIKAAPKKPNRSADPSLDWIEWYKVYVLLDLDGDGVPERHCVALQPNKVVLKSEPAPFVPYAAGAALVNPGRMMGVSLYHKLKQVWDSNTAFLRAAHDNANAANKSRLLYLIGKVEQADLEDGRVNGALGVSGVSDVRQAAAALTVPDISGGLLLHLQEGRKQRTELGGASLELASGQAQLTDRVGSQGVDRMYSVMEQLAALMTRTLAETLVSGIYLLTHRTLREYVTQPITVWRAGVPVTTNPAEWPERERVRVKLGLSPGERTRKAGSLQFYLNAQMQLAQLGMTNILVAPDKFYGLLLDWGRIAEVDNPEQYWIDPASDPAKKAAARKDMAAAAEQKAQQQLTAKALGFEQLRIALERYSGDADRTVEVFKAILGAQSQQATVVGNAARDFELADREAERLAQQPDAGGKKNGKANGKTNGAKRNGAASRQ